MKKLTKYNTNYFTGTIGVNTTYHLFQREGQPICIKASFAAGARFAAKPGLAHFLEHMLLAGTENYPNKRILVTPLENIGGSIGGTTDMDLLTLSLEIPEKKDLSIALSILDEVINKPLFENQTIETERGAILAESQIRYRKKEIRVVDLADTLYYQGTPCGILFSENEVAINSISKDDLINFYEKIFKKSSINWTISGDIEKEDVVGTLATIHKPTRSFNETFSEKLTVARVKTIEIENSEDDVANLYFGFRTESAGQADAASLDVISTYLFRGRGCKLQEELRYKLGLIYGCGGDNFLSFDRGDWSISTTCHADNAQKVLDTILREVGLIKNKGISEEELELTKNKIIKNNIIKMQTSRSWVEVASKTSFLASPEKFLIDDYEKAIENVSNSSIMEVAKKYFSSNNWYLSMCGPKSLENIKVSF